MQLQRKVLRPNNRSPKSRKKEFVVSRLFQFKSFEQPRIFTHLRPGRTGQDDGASGGGKVVGKQWTR